MPSDHYKRFADAICKIDSIKKTCDNTHIPLVSMAENMLANCLNPPPKNKTPQQVRDIIGWHIENAENTIKEVLLRMETADDKR